MPAASACHAASTSGAGSPRTRPSPDPRQHRGPDPVRRNFQRPGRPGRDVPGLAVTDWLIDKSALVRLGTSPDGAGWASRIERGLVRITTVTRLEIGCSARSGADLRTG